MTGPPLNPLPVYSEQKSEENTSPVVRPETNLIDLERPPLVPLVQSHPPTTSVGYHRPGHSESYRVLLLVGSAALRILEVTYFRGTFYTQVVQLYVFHVTSLTGS